LTIVVFYKTEGLGPLSRLGIEAQRDMRGLLDPAPPL
jgi:hypothetical protein